MGALKSLFIGGTGTISAACVARALEAGIDVTALNRGLRNGNGLRDGGAAAAPASTFPGDSGDDSRSGRFRALTCDISDEQAAAKLLDGEQFDVVADFIAYKRADVERDIRLFAGKTRQFIFISSAAAYQKPAAQCPITESAPLGNRYWQYARDKVECELLLGEAQRRDGFPATIVRPSHTYCERSVPVGLHGKNGSWQTLRRILDGKPVLVHGDGLTFWTFTHSIDFAEGFVGLLGNPRAVGEAVHITSDESLTWNAAYGIIGDALGRAPVLAHVASEAIARRDPSLEGPLLGDKSNSVTFDNSKIKRLAPGFHARIRYDQGVRLAVEHILARPELQRPDPEFDAFCDETIASCN